MSVATALVWGRSPKQRDHREHAWLVPLGDERGEMAFPVCDNEPNPSFERELTSSQDVRCEDCEAWVRSPGHPWSGR